MSKRALISGITGQDGSYLAEYLLGLGYEVHGLVRRVALEDQKQRLWRIQPFLDRILVHPASMESYQSLLAVLNHWQFDECYHLAAQSFVTESFADPFTTMNVNINGTHFLLDSIRNLQPSCKFYFAGSSEMFGKAAQVPQNESTPFHPRSPYGISKVAGFHLTRHYREAYGMFACSGILFNHESPRRGMEFVTRKITNGVVRIKLGLDKHLDLGNLDAVRDWGHAAEYVRAMHLMLQQDRPDDYVVATGIPHTVRDFCMLAFGEVGLNWKDHVRHGLSDFQRPAEVDVLVGDASKAKERLGWEPYCLLPGLVSEMVWEDMRALEGK
jgi:GDPmannose 4,6-dehydratase